MPGNLTKPAIGPLTLEQATLDLWQEFLSGYFDGEEHDINGETPTWPLAELKFQQAHLSQPLNGNAIHLVWTPSTRAKRRLHAPGVRTGHLKTQFNFLLRSQVANTGTGGSQMVIKILGDMLYALLSNKGLTLPLANKGITHIESNPPKLISASDYATRSVLVSAELTYLSEV